jgi:DNA-directed RNA polymerase subunit RPC12/RpoP
MSSAAIRLICPNLRCRALLSVPPTARGKNVRCRQCGTRIQVPDKGKPKPTAPAASQDTSE